MQFKTYILSSVIVCAAAGQVWAAGPTGGALTCASPVAAKDSAKAIKAKMGKDAVVKTLPGAEGQPYKALVIYPKDKAHELIVSFSDDKMTKVSSISPGAEASAWTVAGISIGSGLDVVQKANGKVFDVSGFDWDYGGFVTGWHGGALDKPMDGGCTVTVRFNPHDDKLPASMSGDGVKIKSDNARLKSAKLTVSELSLNFPEN